MPRLKRPPKTLRSATTYKSRKSIYAPSIDGSTSSVGRRLVVRRLDQSKGKGRAEPDDGEEDELDQDDEVREGIKRDYRDRAEKAWQKRRETEPQREEVRAERLIGTGDDSELPSDDLLSALHYHTSKFYTSHSLLLEPYHQSRARHWGSKKRMYLQTEGVAPIEKEHMDKDTWAHIKPIKRRRVMSVPVWAARDDEGDGEGDEGEDQEGGENEEVVSSEEDEDEAEEEGDQRYQSEDGARAEDEDDERSQANGLDVILEQGDEGGDMLDDEGGDMLDGDDPDAREDGPDSGDSAESPRKGKISGVRYKRRDMYKSLDGTAMLALGFLVEKFIATELQKAGYRPRDRAAPSEGAGPVDERNDTNDE